MRVVALKRGYFGKLREAGEAFNVPDGTQASWFATRDTPEHESVAQQVPVVPKVGRPRKTADPTS